MAKTRIVEQAAGLLPSARLLQVRRIHDVIRTGVMRGGEEDSQRRRLPSEVDMMADTGASRDDLREALALLARQGVIERLRGVGTLSSDEYATMDTALTPAGKTLAEHQRIAQEAMKPRLLFWSWVKAPAAVADRLSGVTAGDDCLCIDYVLTVADRPVGVLTNYVRAAEGALIKPESFSDDINSMMHHSGIHLADHEITLSPAFADDAVAVLLEIVPGEPIAWYEETIFDQSGDAIDYVVGSLRREVRYRVSRSGQMLLSVESTGTST